MNASFDKYSCQEACDQDIKCVAFDVGNNECGLYFVEKQSGNEAGGFECYLKKLVFERFKTYSPETPYYFNSVTGELEVDLAAGEMK